MTLREYASPSRHPASRSTIGERDRSQTGEPIATVGMACRFPCASDLYQFAVTSPYSRLTALCVRGGETVRQFETMRQFGMSLEPLLFLLFSICLAPFLASRPGYLKLFLRDGPGSRCGRETVREKFCMIENPRFSSQFVSQGFAGRDARAGNRFCGTDSVGHAFLRVKLAAQS